MIAKAYMIVVATGSRKGELVGIVYARSVLRAMEVKLEWSRTLDETLAFE